jgi:hypothetical protein
MLCESNFHTSRQNVSCLPYKMMFRLLGRPGWRKDGRGRAPAFAESPQDRFHRFEQECGEHRAGDGDERHPDRRQGKGEWSRAIRVVEQAVERFGEGAIAVFGDSWRRDWGARAAAFVLTPGAPDAPAGRTNEKA